MFKDLMNSRDLLEISLISMMNLCDNALLFHEPR